MNSNTLKFKCSICGEISNYDLWNKETDKQCGPDVFKLHEIQCAYNDDELEDYYYFCPECKEESQPQAVSHID